MKICISADSTCDLPKDIIKKHNIQIIPLIVNLGDNEYTEDQITYDQIYDFVSKTGTLPKTAAISTYTYTEHFKKLRETFDAVIHFSLSNEISSTGPNAELAAKEIPGVYVIDTRHLSSGSGVLVLSCIDKLNAGKSLSDTLAEIKNEILRVQSSFIINKLDYLHKGGRCSAIAKFGANIFKLKIQINLVNGKMQAGKKYMGKLSVVLPKYVEETLKEHPPVLKRCFVTSSSPMEEIKPQIIEQVKAYGFEEVIPVQAGATICSHCGPETLGILYMQEA